MATKVHVLFILLLVFSFLFWLCRILAFGIEVQQMDYLDVRDISDVPQEQDYLCHWTNLQSQWRKHRMMWKVLASIFLKIQAD